MAEIIVPTNRNELISSSEAAQPQVFDERIDGPNGITIEQVTVIPPLKFILVGKGDFAEALLLDLIARGHEPVKVYGPAKTKESPTFDKMRLKARELGIPDDKFSNFKDPEELRRIKEKEDAGDNKYGADIIIGADFTDMATPEMNAATELGMWGWHGSGLLDEIQIEEDPATGEEKEILVEADHRGGSAVFWQIFNGKEKAGMSINALGRDEDIIVPQVPYERKSPLPEGSIENDPNDTADKGPILAMKYIDLGPDVTNTTAVRGHMFPEGVKFFGDTIDKMAVAKSQGKIYRGQMQIEGSGSYQPKANWDHAELDLARSAKDNHNRTRAASFAMGGHVFLPDGRYVSIYDTEVIEGTSDKPGVLESYDENGAVLTAGEGRLLVRQMRTGEITRNEKGIPTEKKGKLEKSADFLTQNNLEPGLEFVIKK